jgi:transcriptional regulator with XRE-family HTH domain
MNINTTIRLYRKAIGLTQRELARRCGLSNTAINFVENGRTGLSFSAFERICNALGTSPAFIFILNATKKDLEMFEPALRDQLLSQALEKLQKCEEDSKK